MKKNTSELSAHHTDEFYHPSAVSEFCARKLAFKFLKDENGNQKHVPVSKKTAATYRKFDNGHYVHDRIQTQFTQAGLIKLCEKKHGLELGLKGKLNPTTKANWKVDDALVEVPLFIEKYKVIGHCDGILNYPDEPILEIKSINKDGFSYLTDAKPEHVLQVHLYMWAMKRERALVLYECKDNQDVKQYWIKRDRDKLIEVAKLLAYTEKCVQENRIPQMQFKDKTNPPCIWCEYKGFCFGGK